MHSKRGKFLSIVMALALVACFGAAACAATLNAYTVMPEKYASQVFEQFTKDTGIKVNFIRFSSGEALARLTAEKKNPQVDILLGGPADVYTAGCDAGVFAEYAPKEQRPRQPLDRHRPHPALLPHEHGLPQGAQHEGPRVVAGPARPRL